MKWIEMLGAFPNRCRIVHAIHEAGEITKAKYFNFKDTSETMWNNDKEDVHTRHFAHFSLQRRALYLGVMSKAVK